MAHIVDFSITGLAGRDDVYARTLDRHVNVFFGVNGTGKTSLLRILDSAMSRDASRLGRVPFAEASATIYSYDEQREFTRSIVKPPEVQREELARIRRLEDSGTLRFGIVTPETVDGDDEPRLHWHTDAEDPEESATVRWPHRYLPTSRLYWSIGGRPGPRGRVAVPVDFAEDVLDVVFAQSLRNTWREYSMEVLARVSQAQEEGLAGILRTVLDPTDNPEGQAERSDGRDPDEAYATVSAFLRRQKSPGVEFLGSPDSFASRYREEPSLQRVVADIERVEQRIENAMKPRRQLEETIQRMFSSAAVVSFSDRSIDAETAEGDSIGLVSLSSGEKHILRILVEALLAGHSTLLIDEPELSLHVDWQRRLVATMRALNPDAQYILATHSPEIMADVPDECIFRM